MSEECCERGVEGMFSASDGWGPGGAGGPKVLPVEYMQKLYSVRTIYL